MESYLKLLEGLGLTDKEAKTYLAALELGSATAQQIAAKAGVARGSAYNFIETLKKRGLMSESKKGKKQYFAAEKPEQLLFLIQEEKKKVQERENRLKAALPILETLVSAVGNKPEIKFYEGAEGLKTMRQVLFASKAKKIELVGSPEVYSKMIDTDSIELHDLRLNKSRIDLKQIAIATDPQKIKPNDPSWNWKILKNKDLELGEMSVFGDYVSLISYLDQPYGVLIKSKEIASLISLLFMQAWKNPDLTYPKK